MSTPLIGVEVVPLASTGSYGIVTMNRAPANALNSENVDGLISAIDQLEANKSVVAFVLTSSIPGFFSAGVDLDMFTRPIEEWVSFWKSFRSLFLRIYESRLVSVAAIQGHSPAGGAILALACHHRIMLSGKYMIGVNEVALGLPVPRWVVQVYVQTVGSRMSEKLLPMGKTVVAVEALRSGLVDQVVDSAADVMPAAIKQVESSAQVNQFARQSTLDLIRGDFSQRMKAEASQDVDDSRRIVSSATFQRVLVAYRKSLASKSKRQRRSKI